MVVVGGLDPSGGRRRPTGAAVVRGGRVATLAAKSEEEALGFLLAWSPSVVAVDSPLSHANGFRLVDREMIKRGYRVLPPGWRGMRAMIDRALRLASALSSAGVEVIETHPSSALKSSGCGSLEELLSAYGLSLESSSLTKDEADAAVAAIVALEYARGRAPCVSAPDGRIYLIPAVCRR